VNKGLLKSISDIYQLTVEKLKPITGELVAEKLMKQIEKSRTISFVDFLNTIAIDGVGKGTSEGLASEYVDLNDFMTTDLPRLSTVETVGAKTATAILLHLASDFEEIRKLAKEMTIQYPVKASTKLQGLVFVITGSFPISREEIKKTILANSGTVSGSVSVKTNYLIAGDNTGSKLTKAKQLGVSVISLEEFNKILEVNV
jgi:DNA ligase (NAD+)